LPPPRPRQDAPRSDAWGEAHPDVEKELAALAQVSAIPHADRSAGWDWELRAVQAAADAFPLAVEHPAAGEAFPATCRG